MTTAIQLLRSSEVELRPDPVTLADGMPMINTFEGSPGLFFKLRDNSLSKIGPIFIGAAAPNADATGYTGNTIGEGWLDISELPLTSFKIWSGTEWLEVSGKPGGVNNDVQFNDDGAFGGSSLFTYVNETSALSLTGSAAIVGPLTATTLTSTGLTTAASLNVTGATSLNTLGVSGLSTTASISTTGDIAVSGAVTTALTVSSDSNTTVTTKGYVDTEVASTVTSVTAGTGLETNPAAGITTVGSVILSDTAVTPGTYTNSTVTVNQQGRVTGIVDGEQFVTFAGETDVTGTPPSATAREFYLNTVQGNAAAGWTGIAGDLVLVNQFVFYTTSSTWALGGVTDLTAYVTLTTNQTISGAKSFTDQVVVPLVPTATASATSKQYTDTKLALIGGNLTGNLTLDTNKIALNVDGSAAYALKVTSASTVSGDGATTLTTKDYVDNAITGADDWTQTGTALYPTVGNSDLLIGGTLPATPNIKLNANGIIQSGDDPYNIANQGVHINPAGIIKISRVPGNNSVFSVSEVGDATSTINMNAQGDASFTGDLTNNGDVRIGGSGTAPNISLNADGSANYKGDITINKDDQTIFFFGADGARDGYIQYNSTDKRLILGTDETGSIVGANSQFEVFNFTVSSDPVISLNQDGSADYIGDIRIGGTLPSSPNISLNADGSGEFVGNVTSGGNADAGAANGARLVAVGLVQASRPTNKLLWAGYTTGTSAATSSINSNGAATFAGTVTATTFDGGMDEGTYS